MRVGKDTAYSSNPNLAIVKFQTFEQQIADQFTGERMIARLTLAFGGLALLLAMIGLYGVTAYTVARRMPEIGIRMAVGGERGNIIAMVMRGAVFQIVVGLFVGIPIALLCVRFGRAQLYEITSASPIIVFGAILTLLWLRLWPDSFRHDALHRLNRPRHCEQSGLSAVAEEYGTATTDHRSHFCDLRVLVVIIGGVSWRH